MLYNSKKDNGHQAVGKMIRNAAFYGGMYFERGINMQLNADGSPGIKPQRIQ